MQNASKPYEWKMKILIIVYSHYAFKELEVSNIKTATSLPSYPSPH
nr:MAG TPA: hypothetical protein [Crassvirales sp.]